jgi:predicted dehydrogenase
MFLPMSTVRLGLIGCGNIARWHLQHLAAIPEAKVVALADPDPAQIERCRQAFPSLQSVPSFEDYRKMLDAQELDAVHINSPHTAHVEQVLDAYGKGLHVLCEKPLVTTVADAKRVIEARDRAGKVGLVSYQRHFQGEFRYIRSKIASGEFGRPTFVSALQCQEWKRLTSGSWRQDPALSGGGQLNDSGSHLVDIVLWTTGLRPKRVIAVCDACQTPVDINSSVTVEFEGCGVASFAVIGDAHGWHEDLTIVCERGAFFMRDGKLTVQDADGARFAAENLRSSGNPDANFIAAVLGREEVQSPFECGLRVMELTEAAYRSAERGGAPIEVGA